MLAVSYPDEEARAHDYTENLSEGGLFVRTEREFQVGDRVTLQLSFPQLLDPHEISAEVVRLRGEGPDAPPGVGVRIPEDRREDRDRLRALVRAAERMPRADRTYRVMLVEDNSLVAAMYTSALRRATAEGMPGLAVELVQDGGEALARLDRLPGVDLIVTDVYMPIMSGLALLERIQRHPRLARIPVVVISAGGEPERERALSLGAAFYLQKPVKYQDLVVTVRALLAHREQGRAGGRD
ncbi:TIGR02266 family protein [Anaeromyxobacter paludicola]|uniref:Response regulatory domain-containing protein n=1 Tax=Anaeromyxobacter paludicola TaxID=2918171 RepID=A0ABN6NAR8_9BACT|nr:TIGR02266 family protein [Anaeromyxobacter paludicola]BDG10325.1 hypothetical protein AMPC_34380 [Anaeromyxobacter paludicola]